MELIDYAVNDLLRPMREGPSIRFISPEYVMHYRTAIKRLQASGYHAIWIDMAQVQSQDQLFSVVSIATAAPRAIEDWGAFEDWMIRLSGLHKVKGHFFYLENAVQFWQQHTLLAGALTDELQLIVNCWASRNILAKAIFELR